MAKNYQRQKIPKKEVHSIVRWLWRQINDQRVSQEDIAARSGVASSTMRKWRDGVRSPRIVELEAVINSLGYQLKVVRHDTPHD